MRIAIIGASADRNKWGNKAVRAYLNQGYEVIPVNPKEKIIEGQTCYASIEDILGDVDIASFYVPPPVGETLAKGVIKKNVPIVYLNPGAESDTLIDVLEHAGIEVKVTCSILAIGEDPSAF